MIEVIGHRGAPAYEPENTIRSFLKAVELKADSIEMDIHLSKDKELVIMHDDSVNRTTNGKGKISDLTLAEIKKLDAGKGERVPTLEEAFEAIPKTMRIHIEIKDDKAVEKVMELVRRESAEGRVVISSVVHSVIINAKRINPRIKTALIFEYFPTDSDVAVSLAESINADAIHPLYRYLTKDVIDTAHSRGLKVRVWTCNDEEIVRDMVKMGVDGIYTNKPDLVVPIIKEAN